MSLDGLLNQSRQSLSEFWMARDARQRTMLAVVAMAAAFGLFYVLLIAPALDGRNQLNKNLPELRQQVALLQVLSKEAALYSEKAVLPAMAISEEGIKAALAGKGLKTQSVMLTGDLAKVQLVSVSFAGTLDWLDDMQKTARLLVVDANIVALAQPDTVNATLTLRKF